MKGGPIIEKKYMYMHTLGSAVVAMTLFNGKV